MPTAVWTGTLSFGLVTVPVRLINATEPKDVRFHLYDRSGRRVRYERVVDEIDEPAGGPWAGSSEAAGPPGPAETAETAEAPVTTDAEPEPPARSARAEPAGPAPVAWDEIRRGVENEYGEVVMLTRDEIERARPQRSRTIEVEDFVDLADIDPVYFEKTYYAVPQSLEAAKPYVLLHRAMREAGRIGIGRFVLRTKPHLVAVRPMQEVLAVETLFFGDEVRDPTAFVPGLGGVETEDRELDLAIGLIDMLKTEWDPAAYADTYREELLRILSEKEPARPAATSEPDERVAGGTGPSAVEELMAKLRESVEAAKRAQETKTKAKLRSKRAG
jgi:DNA end-binding protein Ku